MDLYILPTESHCLSPLHVIISPPPDLQKPPPDSTEELSSLPVVAPAPVDVSSGFEPNRDILDGIHDTITKIKTEQKALEDKKWYYTDRHGRQVDVGERVRKILRSVEDCAKIVDVAIQHHPEVSSLVWAGARFILMVGHLAR